MIPIRFFSPAISYAEEREEILDIIDDVLTRGDLILRKDVAEFEERLAKYVGTTYAVGVASGTDALLLSLKALGIGQGDEVIAPSYTFRATIEAIVHAGATPVLTDLDENWQDYITEKTKAVIPAHLEGDTLDWEPIEGIHMIEDSCQAIGAAPVRGITACYSFYPAKLLGCYGDGGAIATNNEALYEKLKIMRNHFKGNWKPVGYNSRLDNLQAAILNYKIQRLPEVIRRRKQIATVYDMAFSQFSIGLPRKRAVYQDYVITCSSHKERDQLHQFLANEDVESLRNEYPFPAGFPKKPRTLEYEARSLRIPCNETLDDEDVEDVSELIKQFYYAKNDKG